jgi:hypothetical protein
MHRIWPLQGPWQKQLKKSVSSGDLVQITSVPETRSWLAFSIDALLYSGKYNENLVAIVLA